MNMFTRKFRLWGGGRGAGGGGCGGRGAGGGWGDWFQKQTKDNTFRCSNNT